MASSDDDEDIKRAIAMSLGETPRSPPPVINLVDSDSEDDDEDMRRAIALSLQENKRNGNEENRTEPEGHSSSSQQYASKTVAPAGSSAQLPSEDISAKPSTNKSTSGILGIDRRAMEQERLARLGKRKRSVEPEKPSKVAREAASSGPVKSEDSEPKALNQAPSSGPKGKEPQTPHQAGIQYPKGAIKRTWAHKHPRTNDIKLEEVFQSPPPTIAILSALQFNDSWVFSKLNPYKTKQIWIMSAKGQDLQDKLLAEVKEAAIPNFRPHFPPMDGNTQHMHSKLMLLFHPTHLRIVVPTANMTNLEWGETNKDAKGESWQPAVMEDTGFLIDLPRREDGQVGEKNALTPFGDELVAFMEAQELGKNIIDGVLKFDFSETKNVAFVHSIPGPLTNKYPSHTGLPGLSHALRNLNLHNLSHLELDYASASLGAIKTHFLKQLYTAACGITSSSSSPVTPPEDFLNHIRIYFPTNATVHSSTGGPDCGGIITLNRSYYNNPDFPKKCMRDYKSTRLGVLSHNKLLFARGRKRDGTPVAWVFVGSHNLSESAWGTLKELKSGKMSEKLNIRNWECGVVVPVPEDVLEGLELGEGEVPPMSVFEGVVEVPFVYPGEEYGGKQPWFFREHME